MTQREEFEAWRNLNWMYIDDSDNAEFIWQACAAIKDKRIAELEARLAAWENREPVAVVGASAPKKVGGIAYGNVIPWTDVPSRPEVVGMFKLLDVGTLLFTKLKEN